MATIEKRKGKIKTIYRAKVRVRGYPPESASFNRLTDARQWAQRKEAEMRSGRYLSQAEGQRHTLAEGIDRYLRDVMPHKNDTTQDGQIPQLKFWKDKLGHKAIGKVTTADIAQVRDELSHSVANATVSRYLAVLSHLFTLAVREWGWVHDNPCLRVTRLREPQGRCRFLSDEERLRLLDACANSKNRLLLPAVVLAMSTGMRAGEQFSLRWNQVDLNAGRIILEKTKNRTRRGIPITGRALELLRELGRVRRMDTDLVFPGQRPTKPTDLRVPFANALAEAEISDFRWHDLRHTCASYLAMSGASLAEIAEVLGHKTLAMVKRYSHLSEGHVASVVSRMNAEIFGGK